MTNHDAYIYIRFIPWFSIAKCLAFFEILRWENIMARLSFCLCTLLLLLSFSVSESRPLRNHDPFSFHFPASSGHFLGTVKHYLYSGSKHRSLSKIDKILNTSAKVSFSISFRKSNATRNQYYKPLRVSPGGPDAHHHFKLTATGGHGRR
jgi:hypothetical protein